MPYLRLLNLPLSLALWGGYRSLHQCIGRIIFAKNFFVALLKDDGKKLNFLMR
ncbi:MAG: hypothetical protein ACJA2G_000653 [Cognaticolwellia sp.]|jgi:hypothetical protein